MRQEAKLPGAVFDNAMHAEEALSGRQYQLVEQNSQCDDGNDCDQHQPTIWK
jgi:hypothetical protein